MDPIVLGPNQVHRFYSGGSAISEFRGTTSEDEHSPEEWVGSATSEFDSDDVGVSVLPDGRRLPDALANDPEGFLGPRHAERFGAEPALLVKLLDAGERLPLHCHPSRAFARRHLDCPYGKTEAWVVMRVRSAEPVVYLGFRDEVEAATLAGWVDRQDTKALLDAMHRIPVGVGDSILVPAGIPHAIGEGVLLAELQEPTDLSVLLEWKGFNIDGLRKGHLGLGFEVALRCVDHSGWSGEHLDRLRSMRRGGRGVRPGVDILFPPEADPFFRAERIWPRDASPLPAGFSILVITRGSGRLESERADPLEVRAGQTVLLPHAVGDCLLVGALEAIRCMPPDPDAPETSAPVFR